VTSSIRSFWQAFGLAAVATLALAGSMAPARAATRIMTMKQDLSPPLGQVGKGDHQKMSDFGY